MTTTTIDTGTLIAGLRKRGYQRDTAADREAAEALRDLINDRVTERWGELQIAGFKSTANNHRVRREVNLALGDFKATVALSRWNSDGTYIIHVRNEIDGRGQGVEVFASNVERTLADKIVETFKAVSL